MTATAFRLGRDFRHRLPWGRMGVAGLLAIPLVLALSALRRVWREPSEAQAIGVLAGAVIYILVGQFILAREWLFGHPLNSDLAPVATKGATGS